MDYRETLNLPRTDFPMKAELVRKEPQILKKWDEEGLYLKILQKREGNNPFVLHDGPPYANGHIHLGTALNKILKDIIVKVKNMSGFKAVFLPGWDCHGLPIELEVEKRLGKEKEKLSKAEIRGLCRKYAEQFVNVQREEFKRLGVFGLWESPYLTMDPRYQATIVREFANFVQKGYVYRGKKPVYWCPSCKTALAEAEVEYAPHESPSIYVKFPLKDPKGIWEDEGKKVSMVIWTTTPWTLPANLAVAVHPEYEYVTVLFEDEVLILARRLVPVLEELLRKKGKVLSTFEGKILEGRRCKHPFLERDSLVILADFVSLETGTGCVHIAPGHGEEDYESGLKYGLEVYAPVDESGRFTDEVAFFKGLNVFEANPLIVEKLKETGTLLHVDTIEHSYPHCWRCKGPVIFRATPQWFISLDKDGLRQKLLRWIEAIKWIPPWGKDRIYNMIATRPDWCISRQRVWGVPIVAFYCESCGKVLLDEKLIRHVASLIEKEGADMWFERPSKELLPEGFRCPRCGSDSFRKEEDILDVWFDSGVSWATVLEASKDLGFPADLYLEGSDQHRGWFQSSLICAVATRNIAPYKAVLTHGFVVDGQGRKMSKSLGNVISPFEVIDRYGAEILRLWTASADYREDVRISEEILQRLVEAYRRIRNTWRFMLGNLYDFDPRVHKKAYKDLWEMDRWILHRYALLTKRIREAYDSYNFHLIYHLVHNFCVNDLSAIYLDISKERLYVLSPDAPKRRSAQVAMYNVLKGMLLLMAPILTFTAEEAWWHLPKDDEDPGSVHLGVFPEVPNEWLDEALEQRWERLLEIRDEVNRALEEARRKKEIGHSLDAEITITGPYEIVEFLRTFGEDLREILIVSQVKLEEGQGGIQVQVAKAKGQKCGRCWVYDLEVGSSKEYPDLCPRCVLVLSGR